MKILRLSIFNIKKHKKESIILIFLIAVSVLFLNVAIINSKKTDIIMDKSFEDTGSKDAVYLFFEDEYRTEFDEVFEEDDRISNIDKFEMLYPNNNASLNIKRDDGSLTNFYASFITEEGEKKISDFRKETTLSDDEIDALEHPIWLPHHAAMNLGYKSGDPFVIVKGGKEFAFQIAGFYESALLANDYMSYKSIVSDSDYDILAKDLSGMVCFSFDLKEGIPDNYTDSIKLNQDLDDKMNEKGGRPIQNNFMNNFDDKVYEADYKASVIEIMMDILLMIAAVVILSAVIVIRHKITNDIDDQMEAIGVLEALGYRSREISLSYVYEYLTLSIIGALFGVLITLLTDPLLTKVVQSFLSRKGSAPFNVAGLLLPMIIIILIVLFSALLRARVIKKYPPVVAFRKGIKTHHFGKNRLSLDKTKSDINLRLGLQNLIRNKKQNIGIFVCILLAGLSIAFCIMVADIFRDGGSAFRTCCGYESGDFYLTFEPGVTSEEIAQELYAYDEVRKITDMHINQASIVDDANVFVQAIAYKDFKETENVFVTKGRLPEHDDEAVLKKTIAENLGYEVGDSIILRGEGVEKSYIITGFTNTLNDTVLLTLDGMKRIMPISEHGLTNVYLKDGAEAETFRKKIEERYGSSTKDLLKEASSDGDLEDRIRAKAEQQMAVLASEYGVTSANYAIKIGDEMITGGTSKIRLTEITTLDSLIESSIGSIARLSEIMSWIITIAVALIISVILNFLIDSTIRKQRKEFGIEKSMGYTSGDIKKQIVSRIMPIAVPAIIAAVLAVVPITEKFEVIAFGGGAQPRYWLLIPAAVVLVIYVYVSAYLSAGRVKKVSVTELMTE
ncbi:MAG: ABC transporter permease [Lachnospiraceae bacterium]|nr:ABC transporter permease [Lachnospiraceae bacterium]